MNTHPDRFQSSHAAANRNKPPFCMGYHHDHDWLQNHQESLCDPFVLPRAERQDLQPPEVRRMLCVGLGSEDAIHASAAQLAEHLLNLGYRHVFCLV